MFDLVNTWLAVLLTKPKKLSFGKTQFLSGDNIFNQNLREYHQDKYRIFIKLQYSNISK
jgi:hypothetical protein